MGSPGAGGRERASVKHCEPDPSYTAFVRQLLDRVGDKWSLLVLRELAEQRMRFTELLRSINGISQRMLTRTLRELERDGLITREVYAEVPPRVEYQVTALGLTLMPHVIALADWAVAHRDAVEAHRDEYDARSALNDPAA
jgi:DNA-binding HxlR family transcriptional regulator